jgi:4-carboxymuconolactone decarboxylase
MTSTPADPSEAGDEADRRRQALEIRDRILGPSWDDTSRSTPGLAMFTEAGIDNIWAGSWVDPTLELRLKSVSTITMTIALRHHNLLGYHVGGALREHLLSPVELRALAMHLNPYVGYPVARDAMVVIDRVIAEHEQGSDA